MTCLKSWINSSFFYSARASSVALSVIFIVFVFFINLEVLSKLLRKSMFYRNTKLMTLISLLAGDIVFALFSLVVKLIEAFVSDILPFLCTGAREFELVLQFEFGLGLVVITLDMFHRHRKQKQKTDTLMALVISSLPWFLGVAVVIPMAKSEPTWTTMLGVSVFLPSTFAFAIIAVLSAIVFLSAQPVPFEDITQQEEVYTNKENVRLIYSEEYPQQANQVDQYGSTVTPVEDRHVPLQCDLRQQTPTDCQPAMITGVELGSSVSGGTPINLKTEAITLLMISTVFCMMVFPSAGYSFNMTDDTFAEVLNWLRVARSCVTPIITLYLSNL